jgi:general stress protein 26
MILNELRTYLQQHRIAVLATVNDQGAPEAALVGVAVTDELDLVFDTLAATRKHANLRRCPRTAVVFSGPGECTVQCEGEASLLDPEAAASAPFWQRITRRGLTGGPGPHGRDWFIGGFGRVGRGMRTTPAAR